MFCGCERVHQLRMRAPCKRHVRGLNAQVRPHAQVQQTRAFESKRLDVRAHCVTVHAARAALQPQRAIASNNGAREHLLD